MTTVKYSPLVTDARGSMDGLTFSTGGGGAYVKERTIPFNPQTPAQQAVRAVLAALSADWSTALDDAQRESWNNPALRAAEKNRVGDKIELTPQAIYTRYNFNRVYPPSLRSTPVTYAPLDTAVTPINAPNIASISLAAITATDCEISMTPLPQKTKLDHYAVISSSKIMRPGAMKNAPVRIASVMSFVDIDEQAVTFTYPDFGTDLASGQSITIEVYLINALTGARSRTVSAICTKA